MTIYDAFAIFAAFIAVCAVIGGIYFWLDLGRWEHDLVENRKRLRHRSGDSMDETDRKITQIGMDHAEKRIKREDPRA